MFLFHNLLFCISIAIAKSLYSDKIKLTPTDLFNQFLVLCRFFLPRRNFLTLTPTAQTSISIQLFSIFPIKQVIMSLALRICILNSNMQHATKKHTEIATDYKRVVCLNNVNSFYTHVKR